MDYVYIKIIIHYLLVICKQIIYLINLFVDLSGQGFYNG